MRVIFLSLFFLVSCSSTLDYQVPTQNFSTPEVVGKTLGVRVQGTFSNSTKFRLAELEANTIFSSQVKVNTEQATSKDNVFQATAGLGIKDFLEVTYRAYADSPDLFGAKAQVYGHGTDEGLKISLLGGYGEAETDNDNFTASNLSGSSQTYTTTLDVKTYELGAVCGYRVDETFLPYIALIYRGSKAEGTLQNASLGNRNLSNSSVVKSAQLGLQLSKDKTYMLLEGGYARSQSKGLSARNDYSLGVSVGIIPL